MMNEPTSNQQELLDLLDQACEGSLDEAATDRLEQLVLEDPAARWTYVQYMTLHATLPRYSGLKENIPAAPLLPLAGEEKPDPSEVLSPKRPRTTSPLLRFLGPTQGLLPWPVGTSFTTAALLLTCLLGLLWWLRAPAPQQPPQALLPLQGNRTVASIAHIFSVQNVQWGEGGAHLPGEPLVAQEWLELKSGIVTVDFAEGARVWLQGPARFQLLQATRGNLEHGKLTARVPARAVGFSIVTPTLRLTDLGTEFGLSATEREGTEVHVFAGEVELALHAATDPSGSNLRLQANQAVRVAPRSAEPVRIALDAQRFQRPAHPSDLILVQPVDVQASSAYETSRAARLTIDGSGLSQMLPTGTPAPAVFPTHSVNHVQMWLAKEADSRTPVLVFDLGEAYPLRGLHYWNHNEELLASRGVRKVEISTSETADNADFKSLGEFELGQAFATAGDRGRTLTWEQPITARRVRITVRSNWGEAHTGLSEIRFLAASPEQGSATPDSANQTKE